MPTSTPLPTLSAGDAIIVGGVVRTRVEPSTQSAQAGSIADLSTVTVVNRVQGENWLLGQQTWLSTTPGWATEWFQLQDGSFVYGPFVFILAEGEASPLAPVPEGVEKWIDVDVSEQTARAMVGDQPVFTAPISSGEPRFPTPTGSLAIEPDGRLAVVRMTASQAGYDPAQATYDVERVLFTQYFDQKGNALHLNYWRPHSVFGNTPTSHGCVGMELHDAQWLWLFGEPGMRVEIHE
jgi:lipoprotein-anchoring transpeptidase ErfK/SrfK